jgi:hypothetical protein
MSSQEVKMFLFRHSGPEDCVVIGKNVIKAAIPAKAGIQEDMILLTFSGFPPARE